MPDDDDAGLVDHNGLTPTECLDARGHLIDCRLRDLPRIPRVGYRSLNRPCLHFHPSLLTNQKPISAGTRTRAAYGHRALRAYLFHRPHPGYSQKRTRASPLHDPPDLPAFFRLSRMIVWALWVSGSRNSIGLPSVEELVESRRSSLMSPSPCAFSVFVSILVSDPISFSVSMLRRGFEG